MHQTRPWPPGGSSSVSISNPAQSNRQHLQVPRPERVIAVAQIRELRPEHPVHQHVPAAGSRTRRPPVMSSLRPKTRKTATPSRSPPGPTSAPTNRTISAPSVDPSASIVTRISPEAADETRPSARRPCPVPGCAITIAGAGRRTPRYRHRVIGGMPVHHDNLIDPPPARVGTRAAG